MATADIITEPGVFIPIIISMVFPFLLLAINKFSRTSESTLTGTIKLEAVKTDVTDLKDSLRNGFDKIENLLNKKDEQSRQEFQRVWERIEAMNVSIKMNTYKIEDMQKKKNGGSPV